MTFRKVRTAAMAALAIGALALSGCAGGTASPGAQDTDLAIAIQSPPPNGWNPALWTWSVYTQISEASYDTLLRIAPDGTIQPGLASQWSRVSPTELRLTLREGVAFSDGVALTADAVKQNIEYSSHAGGRNAPFLAGVTTEVAGDREVVLRSETPRPDLERILSQNMGMMISPTAIANPELMKTKPYGAGPYTLDTGRSITDDTYVFTKDEKYWDAGETHYEKLTFRIIQQPEAAFNAVRSGQVDMVYGDYANVSQARASANLKIDEQAGSTLGLIMIGAGTEQAPALADVRVRQALNYAINRKDFADHLVPGTPTSQIFGVHSAAHNDAVNDYYGYDPDKARALLAAAGYANGFTLPILTFPANERTLEAIAADFARVGVSVERVVKPVPEYAASATAREYPVIFAPLTDQGAYIDIREYLLPTGSKSPRFEDPEITRMYTQALAESSEADRSKIFQQIASISVKDAWLVPIEQTTFYYYSAKTVTGLTWPQGDQYPSIRHLSPAKG